jgi:hypothetical protein
MRKFIAVFIAICTIIAATPSVSFGRHKHKKKDKAHSYVAPKPHVKQRQMRKAEKRVKKMWARNKARSNDYREAHDKHVGERLLKKQTKKEQKKRIKNHIKP